MKRCPTCSRTFTDRNLTFCVDDGTPLVTVDVPGDEETLVVPHASGDPASPGTPPAYQPPGSYGPPGFPPGRKRRVWPWVVGLLALVLIVVGGFIVAAVILIPRMARQPVVVNPSNRNANVSRNDNSNPNRNNPSNENSNDSPVDVLSPPPTDEATVLTDLTDLENEWTVANINADTAKLDRILADDYAGTSFDGKTQGKADYLRTIERDTVTQDWGFEDLKLDLNGDRATLTGLVRFEANGKRASFNFVDKFVWRDGRWQATASEVSPIK